MFLLFKYTLISENVYLCVRSGNHFWSQHCWTITQTTVFRSTVTTRKRWHSHYVLSIIRVWILYNFKNNLYAKSKNEVYSYNGSQIKIIPNQKQSTIFTPNDLFKFVSRMTYKLIKFITFFFKLEWYTEISYQIYVVKLCYFDDFSFSFYWVHLNLNPKSLLCICCLSNLNS